MMFTLALLTGITAGLSFGSAPTVQPAPEPTPVVEVRETNIVIVTEDEHTFDADPPDTVLVLMNNDEGWITRCENMGGVAQMKLVPICIDVDY
jgi:hypothetical protein